MASRRMKMKVAVNVGRGGPTSRPGVSAATNNERSRPITPVNTGSDCDSGTEHIPVMAPRSPVKHFAHLHYPQSPVKGSMAITASPALDMSVAESGTEEGSNVFSEEEVASLSLVPVSPVEPNSPRRLTQSPRSVSPVKNTSTALAVIDESRRGPGTGPSLKPSTGASILNNIQKEIGPVHVAHVTSNETLRQRLQKGSGSSNTKYSILRKEFLATTKKKNPEKKDLTILHFTFWNPPNEDAQKKADIDDLFEGIDTSTMKVAEFTSPVSPPPTVVEEAKKPIGPRVKVGPDGELIIDEQSLVVETSESVRAKKQLSEMETVMAYGSGYYRHKRIPRRGFDWTVKETVRFFKALTMCGTDFSMMAHLFPKRNRAELKAKFKREDRKNSQLVSQALSFQTFDPMESMTESDESEEDEPTTKRRRCLTNNSQASLPGTEIHHIKKHTTKNMCRTIVRRQSEEVPIENIEMDVRTPLAIEFHPTEVSTSTEDQIPLKETLIESAAPKRKLTKKSTSKKEKLSNLPGFNHGRPMGIGDSTKIKAAFQREKKQAKLEANLKKSNCDILDTNVSSDQEKVTKGKGKQKKKSEQIKPKGKRKLKNQEAPSLPPDNGESEEISVTETEAVAPDPRLEILRFDAEDPLGLKVAQAQNIQVIEHAVSSTAAEMEQISRNSENPKETTSEVHEVIATSKDCGKVTSTASPPLETVKERRSMKFKVKPRIPRVPGGGGPAPRAEIPVHEDDEIEIEISCL